jgi:hypothetical protein
MIITIFFNYLLITSIGNLLVYKKQKFFSLETIKKLRFIKAKNLIFLIP